MIRSPRWFPYPLYVFDRRRLLPHRDYGIGGEDSEIVVFFGSDAVRGAVAALHLPPLSDGYPVRARDPENGS
jgi:hypothetical protein